MTIGWVGIGLVWGWLSHHLQRLARHPGRSLALLSLETAGITLLVVWRFGGRAALTYIAAMLLGGMLYGAWREAVARRAVPSGSQQSRR